MAKRTNIYFALIKNFWLTNPTRVLYVDFSMWFVIDVFIVINLTVLMPYLHFTTLLTSFELNFFGGFNFIYYLYIYFLVITLAMRLSDRHCMFKFYWQKTKWSWPPKNDRLLIIVPFICNSKHQFSEKKLYKKKKKTQKTKLKLNFNIARVLTSNITPSN